MKQLQWVAVLMCGGMVLAGCVGESHDSETQRVVAVVTAAPQFVELPGDFDQLGEEQQRAWLGQLAEAPRLVARTPDVEPPVLTPTPGSEILAVTCSGSGMCQRSWGYWYCRCKCGSCSDILTSCGQGDDCASLCGQYSCEGGGGGGGHPPYHPTY
jgi:hypothetical protein